MRRDTKLEKHNRNLSKTTSEKKGKRDVRIRNFYQGLGGYRMLSEHRLDWWCGGIEQQPFNKNEL